MISNYLQLLEADYKTEQLKTNIMFCYVNNMCNLLIYFHMNFIIHLCDVRDCY